MKKKILQYTGGMNRAGAETLIMNIYRNFDRDKYEFHFISHFKGKCDYDDEIAKLGGKIIYIDSPRLNNLLDYKKDLINIFRTYGPYDAIHCHVQLFNGLILKLANDENINIRISHAHSNSDCKNKGFFRDIYKNISMNLIEKYSTTRLACSSEAGINLYKKNKFLIFKNCIDLKKYNCSRGSNLRKELNISDKEKIILHVGRFVELKNHKFILRVFKKLLLKEKKYKLLLVGDGKLFEDIKDKVDELKLNKNVYFLGVRNDIENIMLNSDLYFMPSILEGLPVSLIEAQAAGLPCIISNNISKECDIGLNLINRLSLDDDLEVWVDSILKSIKPKLDYLEKKEAFNNSGFSLEKNIEFLEELYSE